MKQLLRDLLSGIRGVFTPTWPEDDEPDTTTSDAAARTRWVDSHKTEGGSGQ